MFALSLARLVLQMVGLLPALTFIVRLLASCTLDWTLQGSWVWGFSRGICFMGNAALWCYEAAPIEDLLSSVTSGCSLQGSHSKSDLAIAVKACMAAPLSLSSTVLTQGSCCLHDLVTMK